MDYPERLQNALDFADITVTRRALLLGTFAGVAAVATGCAVQPREPTQSAPPSPEPTTPTYQESAPSGAEGLSNPRKKDTAARVISTFENSTTEIQYGYAERLEGDGRGITAGRAGFTSGTSDLLEVVERYMAVSPENNPLASYLEPLRKIDASKPQGEMSGDTTGLDGFEATWEKTSKGDGGILNKVQDEVVDEWYFNPAIEAARERGVSSPLGQLIVWDTITQHGGGDDPDSLMAIMNETAAQRGRATKENESEWLSKFLDIRRAHLENPANSATRDGWRASVSRVDALRSILDSGNLELARPLSWSVYGDHFVLR